MKLGNYVELMLKVSHVDDAISYYEQLGFRKLGDDVLTDGSINIRLSANHFASPTLHYRGSDIQAIKQLFSPNKRKDKITPGQQAEFKDPSGLRVMLTESDSPAPMPKGTPTTRTPISKLGKFGELTIPVKSLSDSLVFWSKLGFSPLHMAEIPYPYAILSDAMIVIGLHENNAHQHVTFTYFAPDMTERIRTLQTADFDIHALSTGTETPENAVLTTADSQQFYLLTGDVFTGD